MFFTLQTTPKCQQEGKEHFKKNHQWAAQETPASVLATPHFLHDSVVTMLTIRDPHTMNPTPISLKNSIRYGGLGVFLNKN